MHFLKNLVQKFQPSSLYCFRDNRVEKTFAAQKGKVNHCYLLGHINTQSRIKT